MGGYQDIIVGAIGVDYSGGRPAYEHMRSLGITYVIRYDCPNWNNSKMLNLDEQTAIIQQGFGLMIVYEDTGKEHLGGAPSGTYHGGIAKAHMLRRGLSTDIPLLIANDTNVTTANVKVVEAYDRAFAAAYGIGPIDIYGNNLIINQCSDICHYGGWLPVARDWNTSTIGSRAFAKQFMGGTIDGVSVDYNRALKPFKAWGNKVPVPPSHTYPPYPIHASNRPIYFDDEEKYNA